MSCNCLLSLREQVRKHSGRLVGIHLFAETEIYCVQRQFCENF